MPALLARGDVQRHHRGGIAVRGVAAVRAPVVRRGVAGGQVDEAQGRIHGRRRPDVGRAAGVGLARRRQPVDGRVAQVPGPDQFAGLGREGAHGAGGLAQLAVVHHPAADDHPVVGDGGRRGLEVEAALHLAHAHLQVDDAIGAKAGTGLAGLRIQRKHPRVDGGGDDPPVADRRRTRDAAQIDRGRRALVVADAAAAVPEERLDAGVVPPALLAGVGVHRDDDVARGADVDRVADLRGRVLVLGAALGDVAGVEGPGDLEVLDRLAVDLVEGGVALAAGIAAVVSPVARLAGELDRGGGGRRPRHALVRGAGQGQAEYDDGQQNADGRQAHRPGAQPGLRDGEQRQEREDRDHQGREKPRDQRPEHQAGFPQGPADGAKEQQGESEAAEGLAPEQQGAGGDQAQAGDQVVGRAVQQAEPRAADQQRQSDQDDEPAAEARAPTGLPAFQLRQRRLPGLSCWGELRRGTAPTPTLRSSPRKRGPRRLCCRADQARFLCGSGAETKKPGSPLSRDERS